MAKRKCPACQTQMAATIIQVNECPNCKRTDIDFYEYEIKALKARVGVLEAENARLQARVAELEAQLENAEGWLDDPSGYWGGGGRE